MVESGEEGGGKTPGGEPLLYRNPDKWGVVNLWLEQLVMEHSGTTIDD
jgi:hypothetical protein